MKLWKEKIHKPTVARLLRPSAMTIDELLKRMMFIYFPIFVLLCFLSATFNTPPGLDVSNFDEDIVKLSKEKDKMQMVRVGQVGREKVNDQIYGSSNSREDLQLDFLLAGFAKTGSTSLLHLFDNHEETSIADREICAFDSEKAIAKLSKILDELPLKSASTQRGIKCPTSIWDSKGLAKLANMQQDLKIIVGVRHPISWFQSYYNYRVTEMHNNNMITQPPPAESLIGTKGWKGVSTDGARFELGLMQLGKAEIDFKDLLVLGGSGRRVFPSSFKVFLYSIDQLEDTDEERSNTFRKDLQTFLGLGNDIEKIPRSNVNHFIGDSRHSETINICDAKYRRLRKVLLKNGIKSHKWIHSKFVHHADVTVGGRDNFLRILDGWGSDPCLKPNTT